MYDASFDRHANRPSPRDRRFLMMMCTAAAATLIGAASAEAQMPSAPVLQNVWATSGLVGAIDIGGGADGTVYAGAVSFSAPRLQFSGGVGYETRTGMNARTVYGVRAALPFGGATSTFGFAAFAGFGGGNTSSTGPDSAASTTQVPLGVAVGWRKAFGTSSGVSLYADPGYVLFSGGSKSGGLFRIGLAADIGITTSLGATVGAELGGTRPRGVGGPSGVLYGAGVSYAFGRR